MLHGYPRRTSVLPSALLALIFAAALGCPATQSAVEEPAPAVAVDATDKTPKGISDKRPDDGHEPGDAPILANSAHDAAHEAGGEHQHTNRLAHETSPYLLLHAHNPVNWHPWDEVALAKAKEEGKPIFLSIGYSSCYWCHVMERESFMDDEIAKFLNENFICIKVDREERPDIDNIYMTSLQMYFQLSGVRRSGGWPLSMFLTPDAEPFIGGTYWPARDGDREGSPGFLTVVKAVHEMWTKDQKTVENNADIISQVVQEELRGRKPVDMGGLDQAMIDAVWSELRDEYDPEWGGFGYAPTNPRQQKFPEPSNLLFLIDRIQREDVKDWEDARGMLTTTLDKMAQGGIYDHLGGGFHRYSVDRFWHIPHFEKMLYDNGQLATVYAQAYELTGDERYRRVVYGIAQFVQREMMHEGGAFFAALDAETDAEEGKYYRWEKDELDELLRDDDQLFAEIYNLDGEPNFVHEGHEFFVPMLSQSLVQHAGKRDMTFAELRETLQPTHDRLIAARQKRKRPLTDTKILTSWNGLMIRGLADAGRLLEDEAYVVAAKKAAQFVLDNLRTEDGRLLRTHTAGEAKLNAYLDDYAFLADGLIALHRATGEAKWLTAAQDLTDKQIELFWDERDGGFFYTSSDHEELLARAKDPVDTVIPSGNSVAAGNLLYLAQQLDNEEYRKKAEQTMLSCAVYLRTAPGAVPRMAVHVAEWLATGERQLPE